MHMCAAKVPDTITWFAVFCPHARPVRRPRLRHRVPTNYAYVLLTQSRSALQVLQRDRAMRVWYDGKMIGFANRTHRSR